MEKIYSDNRLYIPHTIPSSNFLRDTTGTWQVMYVGNPHCPQCMAESVRIFTGGIIFGTLHSNPYGWYCPVCGYSWCWQDVHCLYCGQQMESDEDSLLCSWCGQIWNEEVVLDAYASGDQNGMVDKDTPKGKYSSIQVPMQDRGPQMDREDMEYERTH